MVARRVHDRQEPSVVLGGVPATRHEDRLSGDLAGAELVDCRGATVLVELDDRREGTMTVRLAREVSIAVLGGGQPPIMLRELAAVRQQVLDLDLVRG